MQVKNMDKNKCKRDVTGGPLEPVPLVAGEAIVPQIRVAAPGDPHPDNGME
jgi:hypothetical protein